MNKLTTHFQTKIGTRIIIAPEILKSEKYRDKCNLWLLWVNIYKLKASNFPYKSKDNVDNEILKPIREKGQTVLNNKPDGHFKNLLSRLLVEDL